MAVEGEDGRRLRRPGRLLSIGERQLVPRRPFADQKVELARFRRQPLRRRTVVVAPVEPWRAVDSPVATPLEGLPGGAVVDRMLHGPLGAVARQVEPEATVTQQRAAARADDVVQGQPAVDQLTLTDGDALAHTVRRAANPDLVGRVVGQQRKRRERPSGAVPIGAPQALHVAVTAIEQRHLGLAVRRCRFLATAPCPLHPPGSQEGDQCVQLLRGSRGRRRHRRPGVEAAPVSTGGVRHRRRGAEKDRENHRQTQRAGGW